MRRYILLITIFISLGLRLFSQTVFGDLGYNPPQINSIGDYMNQMRIGEEKHTWLYCLINNKDVNIDEPIELTEGDAGVFYFTYDFDSWYYGMHYDLMVLFPASLPEGVPYAYFGVKYNFGGFFVDYLIKVPDDLPLEDQIAPFLYNGQMVKGGIVRNVPLYDDYGIQIRLKTTQPQVVHRAVEVILRPELSGVLSNPNPQQPEEPDDVPYIEEPIPSYPSKTVSQTNYIVSVTPLKDFSSINYNNNTGALTVNGAASTKTDDALIDIQYFDGLGRPIESVQKRRSPNEKDLASVQEYDSFGRSSRTWLTGITGLNSGAYVNPNTVIENVRSTYADQKPYSMPVYEASPLNRVMKQFGPGVEWQNADNGKGKAVEAAYKTNSGTSGVLSCALFTVDGSGINIKVKKDNFYTDAQLYVTESKDEDGNTGYEFKNKLGQVVLTRQMDGTASHDTYYVYDDFGNLCFVLPPLASEVHITNNGTAYNETNSTPIKQYAYLYKYDDRNRCIAKKLPGCEWIYYVYDKADRLIFTQDGEQYNKSPKEWTFTIPDAFGRVVVTGICKNTLDYTADPLKNVVVKADRQNANNTYKGYGAPTGITLTGPTILSVNYYDDYAFMGYNGIPAITDANIKPETISGYGTQYAGGYKGLLTGALTAQFTPQGTIDNTYPYSVMYYDDRGRVIQTKSANHLKGIEKEYIAYNFTGQPTKKLHIHTKNAQGDGKQTEAYAYTYDHAGRLLTTTHQLTDGASVKPQVTLAENSYDELGRLKTNKKGGQANLNTTYGYNVRSWTNSIVNNHFNETLAYTYSGNISSMQWGQANKIRKYNFIYDNLSRLKAATYTGDGNYSTSYTYDKHGNMMTLQRYGLITASTYGQIDNLTMTYTGNQMKTVSDAVGDIALNTSMDFKDYSNLPVEYTYNKNGAMTQDLNKGISQITYNSLNLPQTVDIKNKTTEGRNEYTYSASGQKLKAVQRWNPNYSTTPVIGSTVNTAALTQSETTDYVGNKIYEKNILKRILVDGGYYEAGNYYFYITDHLGNNRIVTNAAASVVQSTQYYPFGNSFADASGSSTQPYKYNGKELDARNGLNMYDYSARWKADWYLPTVDPHAENYYSWSPYTYVGNNPIKFIDPDGRDLVLTGTEAQAAFEVLKNRYNKGITLTFNSNTNYMDVSINEGVKNLSSQEQLLYDIIKNSSIDVRLETYTTDITFDGTQIEYGGAFLGNTLSKDGKKVVARQAVCVPEMNAAEKAYGESGIMYLHEISEAYEGGKNTLASGIAAKKATNKDKYDSTSAYRKAHDAATRQPYIEQSYNGNIYIEYKKSGVSVPGRTDGRIMTFLKNKPTLNNVLQSIIKPIK